MIRIRPLPLRQASPYLVYLFLNVHLLFDFVELQILVIQQHHIDHGIVGDPTGAERKVIFDIQFLYSDLLEDLASLFEGSAASRMATFRQLFGLPLAEAAVVDCRILHS